MEIRLTEIPQEEALRYLGVRGAPDEILRRDLARCAALLLEEIRPRTCWRLFPLEEDGLLAGTAFRPEGQAIRRHLAGCGQVIVLAATLGMEAETLLRRAQSRSISDALLLDAFLDAVRAGEAAEPTGEVGLRTVRVVAAAQESVRTGQPVALAGV